MGDPPCYHGEPHEVGRNRHGVKKCKHCHTSLQTIVTGASRGMVKGDFRVVCEGVDGDGVCPIGPSDPTPAIELAQAALRDHQAEAIDRDGEAHHAKIIQL